METREELEQRCERLLTEVASKLDGKMNYGLPEWISQLRDLEHEDDLNAQIAYDLVLYPQHVSLKLLKAARLRNMERKEQFYYVGRLNAALKKLLEFYPTIDDAARRLEE